MVMEVMMAAHARELREQRECAAAAARREAAAQEAVHAAELAEARASEVNGRMGSEALVAAERERWRRRLDDADAAHEALREAGGKATATRTCAAHLVRERARVPFEGRPPRQQRGPFASARRNSLAWATGKRRSRRLRLELMRRYLSGREYILVPGPEILRE